MALYDQVELLCQAILDRGEKEAARIVAQARDQAARMAADEEVRGREVLEHTRREVQAQAHLAARSSLDRAELDSKRLVAQAKEARLNEALEQGRERLLAFRESAEYPEWLKRSLLRILGQLEGESFRVAAHPEENRWLTPELMEAVSRESGRKLEFSVDAELPPGGFTVTRADGRVRYDQTFQGLMERQRESLRAELARRLWGG